MAKRIVQTGEIAKLSAKSLEILMKPMMEEIKGGRSSIMLGYAGTLHYNDLMHSMGLITDLCYNNVQLMSSIFDVTVLGVSVFGALFGGGGLKPVLSALVEGDDEDEPESKATKSAELAAIAKTIASIGVLA